MRQVRDLARILALRREFPASRETRRSHGSRPQSARPSWTRWRVVRGSGDDAPIEVYNQNQTGTVTSPVTKNNDLLAQRYKGLDFTVTRRKSKGWQLLAGYTFSTTQVDATSVSTPNNAYVNAAGETADAVTTSRPPARSTSRRASYSGSASD